ncbi:DUF6249 domain-containing protein [Chitinophaga sp.]|uniref:DUF6249 domain-containing protein n=1 Tax=Chitinophaga sp. TaxID=1869181 RepID=UPI002BB34A58|nr:DUF6249 domain-containing protein [Chitinophaga sp.]HWV68961.1 DUF6249 domain-containing protein [Chitinophaga sp.]
MEITSASLFIAISLVVFGISYYYFTTRYKERMTIIERGLPPDYFKESTNYLLFILLLGIVSIGIALGVVTGSFLRSLEIGGIKDFVLPAAVLFFLGLSLLISYFVLRRMVRKK